MATEFRFVPEKEYLPYQLELNNRPEHFKGMITSRGTGKTAWLIKKALTNAFAGYKVTYWLQTQNVLKNEFFPERIQPQLDKWGIPHNFYSYDSVSHTFRTTSGGLIRGFSYEAPENSTGLDAVKLTILDEITTCRKFDQCLRAFGAAQRGLGGVAPETLFAATPRADAPVKAYLKEHPEIYVMRGITMYDNPYLTDEEREQIASKYTVGSPLYRQEVLGEEVDGLIENAVFPVECWNKTPKDAKGTPSMGIDCAGSGRDYNVFYVVDDVHIIEKVKIQRADTFQLHSTARQLIMRHGIRQVSIDCTGGFGNGLYDLLKVDPSLQVYGVNFGQAAMDTQNYANARAEMFFVLSKAMQEGFFVDEAEVISQLRVISFILTPTGKSQLISKEDIKRMIGCSPDSADALALAYYMRRKLQILDITRNSLYNKSKSMRLHNR